MAYDIGDQLRLTATFKTLSGVAADTTVAALIKSPSGKVTAPTVLHNGTGVYYTDVLLDESGEWAYKFSGTGSVTAAFEGRFLVNKSEFA